MRQILVGTLAVILLASAAGAAEPERIAAGDYMFDTFSFIRLSRGDLTWSGAFAFVAPAGVEGDTTFSFQGSVGYFVTDYWEVEGGLVWQGAENYSGLRIGIGANRYFGEWTDNIFPYIGAGLSRGYADLQDEGTRMHVKIGIRHYLTRHMGLRYWGQFDTTFEEIQDGGGIFSGYIGIFAHPF